MRTLFLLSLTFVLSATVPVVAQDTDWQRYYPLEVGDTWDYRYNRSWCFVDECEFSERFDRRTVLGEIEIDGVPYAEVEVSKINPATGAAECTATVALRLNEATEMVEEGGGGSSCGFYAPELDVPLTIGTPHVDDVTIGGIGYSLSVRSEYVYLSNDQMEEGEVVFAEDVGLVSSGLYSDFGPGHSFTAYTLVYAEVGGVVYGASPVANEGDIAPAAFALGAVYPNPFRSSVTLSLDLPTPERVTLAVFDVLGRRVLERDLGVQPAGTSRHTIDGTALTPGIYFVRAATASGRSAARRIVRVE